MALDVASIANRQGELVPEATTVIKRNNTAAAILEVAPDILAVQEIENIYTLRNFNHRYLDDHFETIISLDGNDPRGIDVGLLLRKRKDIRVDGLRTHIDDPVDNKKPVTRQAVAGMGYRASNAVFSRDCLEVDVSVGGRPITLLINHLKAQDGTAAATKRRLAQAVAVKEIAAAAKKHGRLPIVLGDLNIDRNSKDGSIEPLFSGGTLADPFDGQANNWSHYYAGDKSVSRLDYILPDKALKVKGTGIFRKGLTTKAKQYNGPRFPTIGQEHTEASDHCPIWVDFDV